MCKALGQLPATQKADFLRKKNLKECTSKKITKEENRNLFKKKKTPKQSKTRQERKKKRTNGLERWLSG